MNHSDEEFQFLFNIYGHDDHLGHVTQIPRINLDFPTKLRFYTQFGFHQPSGFREDFKTTESEGPLTKVSK